MTPRDVTELLGGAAAFCTTLAFVPQLVRVWTTKSTRDVSLGMFLVFCVGLSLWLAYGLRLGSTPLVASNSITLVLALGILVAKLRFG